MSKDEMTSSATFDKQALLHEVKSLGLATWVIKPGASARLRNTEWVEAAGAILGTFDEKDRMPILEGARTYIEGMIKQGEAEVICAFLRLAAANQGGSQAGVPDGPKRKPRTPARTAEHADAQANGNAGTGKRRGKRQSYTPEEKGLMRTMILRGDKRQDIEQALGKPLATSTFAKLKSELTKTAGSPAGGDNQGQTQDQGPNNGEGQGSEPGPSSDDSGGESS